MRRRGFDQGHVAHAGAARDAAFQQVMAEHLVLRQAPGQHGLQSAHVQQALAGEAAFIEQVLVDLGGHCVVRVTAAGTGKEAVKAGGLRRARPGRDDARLQDAVAGHHAAKLRIHARLVQRVRGNAHQLAQGARLQHGVAVQRDDVGRARGGPRTGAKVEEGLPSLSGQHAHELLQLAALALPTDEALLTLRPAALAVQQQEARRLTRGVAVAGVQRLDGGLRCGEQPSVTGLGFGWRVGKVGEQAELRVRFTVGQVVLQKPPRECGHGGAVGQQRRQHDEHAVLGRNATA